MKEGTGTCEICGKSFVFFSSRNRPRKTCDSNCRDEMRKRDGGYRFDQSPNDPTPDEIVRRAQVIRQINEKNLRADLGRPRIAISELDWYT